ncbi:hypothetical protein BV22DRAFT_509200 [Leucogyrophana mollusca]|uniref:Uncharacterized protein n=1 Tax=Leucogyrophana mollusca TaxID=85980 RepID=A0ACB8BGR9_9AGAM|nr:hypothetical protein BV22DRAFT_509200 [Leucogyrophana mollusca]
MSLQTAETRLGKLPAPPRLPAVDNTGWSRWRAAINVPSPGVHGVPATFKFHIVTIAKSLGILRRRQCACPDELTLSLSTSDLARAHAREPSSSASRVSVRVATIIFVEGRFDCFVCVTIYCDMNKGGEKAKFYLLRASPRSGNWPRILRIWFLPRCVIKALL